MDIDKYDQVLEFIESLNEYDLRNLILELIQYNPEDYIEQYIIENYIIE